MKRETSLPLSIAAVCLLLLSPAFVQARSVQKAPAANSAEAHNARMMAKGAAAHMIATEMAMGKREARSMAPAQASLLSEINARKIRSGYLFRARLTHTVYLKNGPELPDGTLLWGKVTTDKMQADGGSKLALRFTRAELKNGKSIPIRAAIMGISAPGSGYFAETSYQGPSPWNGKTLQLDEIGAISGIDLHSRIGSMNSGVFVAKKKDDVKLSPGSHLALAIAERGSRKNLHGKSMTRGA